jgi:hypothetical protein
MRQAFAHDALLQMAPDADAAAPGAAVTEALCGQVDHEPPCPLAPHASSADRGENGLRLRILFAAEPDQEALVRARIDGALSAGRTRGPRGATARWALLSSEPGRVRTGERDHAERLRRS